MAAEIMKTADRHCRNGALTVNEMRTFLRGSKWDSFMAWLSAPHTKDVHWKQHDRDLNGSMDIAELEEAVAAYLRDTKESESEEQTAAQWRPGRGGSWTNSIMSSIRQDVEEELHSDKKAPSKRQSGSEEHTSFSTVTKVATPREWRELGLLS